MKKVLGIILIVIGLVCLPQVIAPNAATTIGGFIGVSLVTFLPAYFLLKSKKENTK